MFSKGAHQQAYMDADQRDYGVFFTHREGSYLSMFVNNSLIDVAPISKFPVVSCLAIEHVDRGEIGWGQGKERDKIRETELKVEALVGRDAVFAGRTTSNGISKFYFYARDEDTLEIPFQTVMADLPENEFHTHHERDRDWHTFTNLLLPTRAEESQSRSTEIRSLLANEGDDGTAPRLIDHFVYFSSKKSAAAFGEKTQPLGFEVSISSKGIIRKTFRVVLSREDVPVDIDPIVAEIDDLAEELGGRHTGWETSVMR
ncbi:MAG: DUF695 domain-containing protein [Litoreibacter sp.]